MTPDEYCAAEGRGERLELLLQLPLPAAAAPARDHRALRVLPRGRRRRRRGVRSGGRAPKLAWWRNEVARRVRRRRRSIPVALRAARRRRASSRLPRERPRRRSSTAWRWTSMQTRYLDFAALELYCHRVAGVVGPHVGARSSATRIPRRSATRATSASPSSSPTSCATSARTRGAGASTCRRRTSRASACAQSSLLQRRAHRRLPRPDGVRGRARARAGTTRALAQLPREDRRAQRAGLAMAAIYRTLLDEIARDGYRVLDRRIALTPLRKLWIAWRTARAA